MAGEEGPWSKRGRQDAVSNDEPAADPAGDEGAADPAASDPAAGPRNPWLPTEEAPPRRSAGIEDIFRGRGKPGANSGPRHLFGGGLPLGGGLPRLPARADGKSWLPLALAALATVWLLGTSFHQLGSTEEGIVTTFGKYSRTIYPGVSLTLPWPMQDVAVADVTSIRRDSIPDGDAEKLMLTADQSLVDLSYLVRWTIKDLKLYDFRLKDPDLTVREVAEAAMRASVAEVRFTDVVGGTGRGAIEAAVRQRMQAVLDAYHAGVLIQGVDIKKADPPAQVVQAFQQVQVAQQNAQRDLSDAQAYAQQKVAQAEGETAAFDKVYVQYKAAPEVTRRRLYYEMMERVLAGNDKVVVTSNTNSYLPLPQLRHAADAAASGGQ